LKVPGSPSSAVGDQVVRLAVVVHDDLPLAPDREGGATAALQAGSRDFLDHVPGLMVLSALSSAW